MKHLLAAALLAAAAAQSAPVEDTMAQRVLACTGCHGPQGRAARDGFYPRIAGKPAGYLYNQLAAFRDGRRHYPLMTALLDPLSDDYLREIAAHFAALDVPYAAPNPATVAADVLARGRTLVFEGDTAQKLPACAGCHGTALTGVQPAVPGLLGLPVDYINAQLGAWRGGERRSPAPDCMAQIAKALAPQDVAAISAWLAAQPVPDGGNPAASLPKPMPLDCGGAAR